MGDPGRKLKAAAWPAQAGYSMAEQELSRFLDAQRPVHQRVVDELTAGSKRTHWMWFVFPQLAGLGRSAMAQRYGIHGLDEARRYLAHPVLGQRLRQGVALVLAHGGRSALEIFGAPDDLKFRSCLTLFREASVDPAERSLFSTALDRFYGGEPDDVSLRLLRAHEEGDG